MNPMLPVSLDERRRAHGHGGSVLQGRRVADAVTFDAVCAARALLTLVNELEGVEDLFAAAGWPIRLEECRRLAHQPLVISEPTIAARAAAILVAIAEAAVDGVMPPAGGGVL